METTPRSEKCGFRWQDTKNHWCEKTEPHAIHECWVCGVNPPAETKGSGMDV